MFRASFLSNQNRFRSSRARQWPPMVERERDFFFPSRRVQTTYRSFSTEERRTDTRSREWGDPRCRVSPKAPLKIVASSKLHKRFTVGQTMRVRAFPSFYSLNRATTQTESSIDRDETSVFCIRLAILFHKGI